jgi:hypothetical protein
MSGFLTKPAQTQVPKPHVFNNLKQLRDLCQNENEHKEVRNHTCSLVKKIEKDFRQPTVWSKDIGPLMVSFETHIGGENYMGGEKADYLWKNEKILMDKWNLEVASHSVHYGQAGGGFSDYGGGTGVAWEWSVHRFFLKLPNNFFEGTLKYNGMSPDGFHYNPTLANEENKVTENKVTENKVTTL